MIPLPVVHDTAFVFDLDHVEQIRQLGIVGILVGTLPKAPQQNVFLGLPLQLSAYEACYLVLHGHAQLVDGLKYNQEVASHYSIEEINKSGRLGEDTLQYAITPDTLPEPPSLQVSAAYTLTVTDFLARQKMRHEEFGAKFAAFCFLRNLDYYLMPGLRFGGVFVAYPGDPLKYHSHLIVKVVPQGGKVDLLELVTSGRLATAVKKAWLVIDQKHTSSEHQNNAELQLHPQATRAYSFEWAGFG